MVKEANACSANFVDYIRSSGVESAGFSSLVFYLDGDDTKGELDLPRLVDALAVLSVYPVGESSWKIDETCDPSGREAIVLYVPTEGLEVLGIDVKPVATKFEEQVLTNGVSAPEKDPYEGKLYYIQAARKGDRSDPLDFITVIQDTDPEDIETKAKAKAAIMLNDKPDKVEVDYRRVDREFFFRTGVRMWHAGRRLSDDVKKAEPRIDEHIKRSQNARKSPKHFYR